MITYSLVIPVYGNEGSLPELLATVRALNEKLARELEVVFVVDASPDRCYPILQQELKSQPFASQLIAHSRNFGSFAAIRTGLAAARGSLFAVMAADLQEPPELIEKFFAILAKDQADVTVGVREKRSDPALSSLASKLFWWSYRSFIDSAVPPGGVDIFGCNKSCRDVLLSLEEANSSLVGLLFWVGFRREFVAYERRERVHGTSGWTLKKKIRYMSDSLYAFSDLPIRMLTRVGVLMVLFSLAFGLIVLIQRIRGAIPVQGYTVIVLAIAFFGGFNALALGVVGGYVWRAFENTKRRPNSIVLAQKSYDATTDAALVALVPKAELSDSSRDASTSTAHAPTHPS
jgi:glycosyltransferase involved in cell wall biosynthesis